MNKNFKRIQSMNIYILIPFLAAFNLNGYFDSSVITIALAYEKCQIHSNDNSSECSFS